MGLVKAKALIGANREYLHEVEFLPVLSARRPYKLLPVDFWSIPAEAYGNHHH